MGRPYRPTSGLDVAERELADARDHGTVGVARVEVGAAFGSIAENVSSGEQLTLLLNVTNSECPPLAA